MPKTRSQTESILSIKKEEEDDSKTNLKHTQLLNGINATVRAEGKTSKSDPNPSSVSDIKLEQDESDDKTILQKQKTKTSRRITQEQIKNLIDYIETNKMSITAASKKVGIYYTTGVEYYKMYKNDPEQKIPERRNGYKKNRLPCSQDQINTLIKNMVEDKMTLKMAALNANMSLPSATKYFRRYLGDSERTIPISKNSEQAVSEKGSTGYPTACRNMKKPELHIPKSLKPKTCGPIFCTQEQINLLIECIVKDGMPVKEASRKSDMGCSSGYKYYRLYFEDPERNIPKAFKQTPNSYKLYKQDVIDKLICYIVDDNMTPTDASRKLHMSRRTAIKYYSKYMDDPNHRIPTAAILGGYQSTQVPQEKIKEFIHYVFNDKMSVTSASAKAKVNTRTAYKYYSKHMNSLKLQETAIPA